MQIFVLSTLTTKTGAGAQHIRSSLHLHHLVRGGRVLRVSVPRIYIYMYII